MTSQKLRPALLGGLFIGTLSALPVVSVANICCCLWLVTGGGLAAWLLQQQQADPVSQTDGATVGFLAGVIGAGVYLVVSLPVTLIMGPLFEEWMARALENAGDVPLRDLLERYRGAGTRVVSLVIGFIFQLALGMVFPTLGGVIGAMAFRKTPPPPPPPSAGPWIPVPPPHLPPPPPPVTGSRDSGPSSS
jgi:hypothetical protein